MVLTRRGRGTGTAAAPARPVKKEKVPLKQTTAVLALCFVGIPLALVAFLLGCGGVAVLMGTPCCLPLGCMPAFPGHCVCTVVSSKEPSAAPMLLVPAKLAFRRPHPAAHPHPPTPTHRPTHCAPSPSSYPCR